MFRLRATRVRCPSARPDFRLLQVCFLATVKNRPVRPRMFFLGVIEPSVPAEVPKFAHRCGLRARPTRAASRDPTGARGSPPTPQAPPVACSRTHHPTPSRATHPPPAARAAAPKPHPSGCPAYRQRTYVGRRTCYGAPLGLAVPFEARRPRRRSGHAPIMPPLRAVVR